MSRVLSASFVCCVVVFAIPRQSLAHPPSGIVVDKDGRLYYRPQVRGGAITCLAPDGKRTTLRPTHNGQAAADPHKLAIDKEGNLYLMGWGGLWKVSPKGEVNVLLQTYRRFEALPANATDGSTEKVKTLCFWNTPLAVNAEGLVYFTNYNYSDEPAQILTVDAKGEVRILAGSELGHRDGTGADAQFRDLRDAGMAIGPDGSLYLTDGGTSIRSVTPLGKVSTLAGSHKAGFADGKPAEARFRGAVGIALDADGNVYVADTGNRRIRKISPDGSVVTVVGSGKKGRRDGAALEASFDRPTGVAVGPDGDMYILDQIPGTSGMGVRRLSGGRIMTMTESS